MVSTRQPLARHARGFTLPELLAVLAILATLSALAAPAFSGLVGATRARSAGSELYASLMRARSEAIKRNAEVTLAPNTAAQWQGGWQIPDPLDASRKLDDHGAVAGATITGPASVVFLPNGRVKGATQPSFDISVSGSAQRRCISVELSGRPNQTKSGC
jgi:type IV fimbrial biogenesis protein FimT